MRRLTLPSGYRVGAITLLRKLKGYEVRLDFMPKEKCWWTEITPTGVEGWRVIYGGEETLKDANAAALDAVREQRRALASQKK